MLVANKFKFQIDKRHYDKFKKFHEAIHKVKCTEIEGLVLIPNPKSGILKSYWHDHENNKVYKYAALVLGKPIEDKYYLVIECNMDVEFTINTTSPIPVTTNNSGLEELYEAVMFTDVKGE